MCLISISLSYSLLVVSFGGIAWKHLWFSAQATLDWSVSLLFGDVGIFRIDTVDVCLRIVDETTFRSVRIHSGSVLWPIFHHPIHVHYIYYILGKGIMANRRAIARNIVFLFDHVRMVFTKRYVCILPESIFLFGALSQTYRAQNSHFPIKSSVPKKLSVKISVCARFAIHSLARLLARSFTPTNATEPSGEH